jgi:hypothetical protein
MPAWFLGTTTLSKADVAQLKTTVDAFAGSYTSGADAAKDKAALDALQSGLSDLVAGIWSENHVVSKDSLAQFQKTVDSFVANYTGGTNLAQDEAAWKALRSGMSDFWASVQGAGGAASSTPMPGKLAAFPGSLPPVPDLAPSGDSGLASMLAQAPISKADVTQLQQAVDAFAADYTSGADPTRDKAAVSNLQSSWDALAQDWVMPMPVPPTAAAPPASPPVAVTPNPIPRGAMPIIAMRSPGPGS